MQQLKPGLTKHRPQNRNLNQHLKRAHCQYSMYTVLLERRYGLSRVSNGPDATTSTCRNVLASCSWKTRGLGTNGPGRYISPSEACEGSNTACFMLHPFWHVSSFFQFCAFDVFRYQGPVDPTARVQERSSMSWHPARHRRVGKQHLDTTGRRVHISSAGTARLTKVSMLC